MNLLNERFFVTGATGFVGASLVSQLVDLGCEVHVLARASADRWRLRDVEPKVRFHACDITDAARLSSVVASVQPTVIYHLATHGAYSTQTDSDRIMLTNVVGTLNLLKACSAVDYKVFVNTGSSSEYGFKQHAMREADATEPNSYYAVAKCAQTMLCQHMARTDRRPINTFRLFSVYGPLEDPSRLFPTIIRRSLEGRPLEMVSPDIARDFVHVDDVVEAFLQIGQLSLQCGEIFNIGTGMQSTIRDVVKHVLAATGANVEVKWGSMPARVWDTETWLADCSKARRVLRWTARTSLAEGVRRTTEWMKGAGASLAPRAAGRES
jgi:nucleoside-diphosphate-sugar epimerase